MQVLKLLSILLIISVKYGKPQETEPCPFNTKCVCSIASLSLEAACLDVGDTFPTFSNMQTGQIAKMVIRGNYTVVPENAFSGLKFTSARVILEPQLQPTQSLAVESAAFSVNGIQELDFVSLTSVPSTQAFASGPIPNVVFDLGDLETIDDNVLNSYTSTSLMFDTANVKVISPDAFNGIKLIDGTGSIVEQSSILLPNNHITEISTAFKTLSVKLISFSNNSITEINDFAFCSCSTVGGCSSPTISIDLSENKITTISNNAFANLPKLGYMILNNNLLTSVPSTALLPIPNIVALDLTYNKITSLEANAFYNFKFLPDLGLSYNPVTTIDNGAFNGLSDVIDNLDYIFPPLTTVDLLVTYGSSVQDFMLGPSLQNLTCSDYTKLPKSLTWIDLRDQDIREISSELDNWLSENPRKKGIDIDGNKNFNCNPSIIWMAKRVNCNMGGIIEVQGTMCAGTNQTLASYLRTLQPTC